MGYPVMLGHTYKGRKKERQKERKKEKKERKKENTIFIFLIFLDLHRSPLGYILHTGLTMLRFAS
jgi:hypothetical protein